MMTDIVAGRCDAGIRVGNLLARDMIAVQISDDLSGYWRLRFPNGAFSAMAICPRRRGPGARVEGPLPATDPKLLVRAAVDGVGILYSLWDFTAVDCDWTFCTVA